MDAFNELVELLYNRWEIRNPSSYSAESLFIGGKGVWLFLTGAAKNNYAIGRDPPTGKYYLKLHWGKTSRHAFELSAAYSTEDFKGGIGWLVSAARILDLYEEPVKAYLAAEKVRLENWNKHRGDPKKIKALYKTHIK